jgi:hypothetical protein
MHFDWGGETMTRALSSLAVLAVALLATWQATAGDVTIVTDADATVRVICRNDRPEADCNAPLGTNAFVRVHDQNNLDTGYWHFDLSDLNANSQVTKASFQLDSQTNSWGNTTVSVFAIVDPDKDWDLNALPEDQITGAVAPQSDWDTYAWTGDPAVQQRFNSPTPFLDEGNTASSIVRELESFILIENQDPLTDVTNSYGGFAGEGGPGTDGSADGGSNVWPVKNAVDIDITDLVRWKLGQNPAYSTFQPKDRELTLLVRTDFPEAGGDNGFVRFIVNESNFLGGELDLQPGRILVMNGANGVGAALQAGDADQDLDFDQFDLIRVQQAAKYLTGSPATWGQGDWNGAPGGSKGSPPPGNGFFDQLDIVAALAPAHYLKGPYAALANANGVRGDAQTTIIYNAGTGEVAVDAPAGTNLTSVNIDSAARIFTGAPAQNLGGSFDNDADGNIFKATFGSSFGSLSFGNVAQPGLAQQFVLNDLTVVGSLAGGGALGNVDLIYIPEPSTFALLAIALLALPTMRRRSLANPQTRGSC